MPAELEQASLLPVRSMADIGRIVRQERKRRRMSQAEFAALCGVGRRFLVELERGKPSLRTDRMIDVLSNAGIALYIGLEVS